MAQGGREAPSTSRGKKSDVQKKDADELTNDALARLHSKSQILRGPRPHGTKSKYNTARGQSIVWTPEDEAEYEVKAYVRDSAALQASEKWEDLIGKGVTHLVIEDDSNSLKEIPAYMSKIQTLRSFTLMWSKVKIIPDYLFSMQLRELCLHKCQLKNIDGIHMMESLVTLELANDGLKKIPMEIGQLTSLVNLDLTGNKLSSLPISIGNLHKLQVIKVCGNSISEIPTSISELTRLTTLDFSQNHIKKIPRDIGNLRSLVTVRLSHNQLSSLPASFHNLHKLKHLYLAHNHYKEVPKLLGQLPVLQTLNMVSNRVSNIPCPMLKLTALLLDKNELTELSEPIFLSSSLEKLSVQYNKLTAIPSLIARLEKLRALYVGGNLITCLPNDICMLSNLRHLVVRESKMHDLPNNFDRLHRLSVIDIEETELDVMYMYALKNDGIQGLLEQVKIKRQLSGVDQNGSPEQDRTSRGSSMFDSEDEAASDNDILDGDSASDGTAHGAAGTVVLRNRKAAQREIKTMFPQLDNRNTMYPDYDVPSDDEAESSAALTTDAEALKPRETIILPNGHSPRELEGKDRNHATNTRATTNNNEETSFTEPNRGTDIVPNTLPESTRSPSVSPPTSKPSIASKPSTNRPKITQQTKTARSSTSITGETVASRVSTVSSNSSVHKKPPPPVKPKPSVKRPS